MEVWRDVKDSRGQYEVSSEGRVRNKRTGRIRKVYRRPGGTCVVHLGGWINKTVPVARLVAEAFITPFPGRVAHKSKDLSNNRPENLVVWTEEIK